MTTGRRMMASLAMTALIVIPATLVSVFPLIFVWSGFQALGGKLGLWVGDPNSNDGEEVWAWPLGLIMLAVLLAVVGCVVRGVGTRVRLARWFWPLGLAILTAVWVATVAGRLPPFWQWRG
ncbi:hypothetical protein GCM10011575_39960 [Microlunatus endophyticus]|uniref:Uncharacterized protein n=1 Tax=Microlunatus endophyticus TaxID=1716077 RepID=A0A917SHJ1_9ACTN|nr:hypothetical protein [Microlunatus endophyticus]GGL77715.1 hypothetical protein GCM10011575_39960 [Microlunatus endophyticus]